MLRSPVLPEIRALDPVRDHQRIVFLTMRVDFPFDTTRALELALFRTFGVPSIAALLDRTGEFERRPQKRYDDTDIIVSELIEHGYESERGRAALARMNEIHGRFRIRNEDFVYVLSTFILEPIRFIERFGWRKLIEPEKTAMFRFWSEVGKRMGIRDVPASLREVETRSVEYEREHFRFTEASRRVGEATRELFAGWFPPPFRPLVRRAIHSLLDDRTREAFGFPTPGGLTRHIFLGSLRARSYLLRGLPRRRRPLLRTRLVRRDYPEGYEIGAIGPAPGEGGRSGSPPLPA
jgi:hypothetical protein